MSNLIGPGHFASRLVARGAPLKAVQDLMGHSTINMTMRYSHLNQESLREAISLLEAKKSLGVSAGCQPTLEDLFKNLAF